MRLPPLLAVDAAVLFPLACAASQKPAPSVEPVAPPPARAETPKAAPIRIELKSGQQAPWLAAFDLEGNPLSLGKVLTRKNARGALVVFFAGWCKACLHELDQVSASRAKLAEAGVEVLLVNVLDDTEKLEALVKAKHLEGLSLIRDATGAVAEAVGLAAQGEAKSADKVALPLAMAVASNGQTIRRLWREGSDSLVDEAVEALKNDPVRGR
jgi:peroxiredoxin